METNEKVFTVSAMVLARRSYICETKEEAIQLFFDDFLDIDDDTLDIVEENLEIVGL